ncbi:MAG TPA: hypothetical protein VNQ77_20565 [Frankiaceae bacterium]|nr:hypothetical protein [Frankiaceae bacterium]
MRIVVAMATQRTAAAAGDTAAARAARNAVGSVRAEGLDPSEDLLDDLDAAVEGRLAPDAVVQRAVERARRTRTRA